MKNNNTFLKNVTRFLAYSGMLAVALFAISIPATTHASTIDRTLRVGVRGADVTALQTFLAQDATLYPQGKITGYFGFLTKAAVSNFQSRNGLTADGIAGPHTNAFLNVQMAGGMGSSTASPIISSVSITPNQTTAVVNWATNESAKGIVYYSATPLTTYEYYNSVDVSGSTAMMDTTFRITQNVAIAGLQANTTYYYLIYSTDEAGNVSVTWPSTFHTAN